MCSILGDCLKEFCIEECDKIDQDLLDILLTPLLPSSRAENPTAYEYISVVLEESFEYIQTPVSAFINHVLLGVSLLGEAKTSRLSAHIYPLIVELHKIQPELLRRVLPSISVQFQAEEEYTSSNPLKVLRELFSSDHADSATEFSKDFGDFLGRFDDVPGVVRLAKDNNVNLMPSTHNDCDANKGNKPMDVSSKIDDVMAVFDLPMISRADDLSLAINVNNTIAPERNSVIDGILASDHKEGNIGNVSGGSGLRKKIDKIQNAMAVSDLPMISTVGDLSLAIDINKAIDIDPERNSGPHDILASDYQEGNGGNVRRGMDDWKFAITPNRVSISCNTTTIGDSDRMEGVRDDNSGVVGLATNIYSTPKKVSNSYKASKNVDIVGGVEG